MSAPILEVISTQNKQSILIKAFEGYINKCKSIANRPLQGYGKSSELEKKKQWQERAEEAQSLLDDIVMEFN